MFINPSFQFIDSMDDIAKNITKTMTTCIFQHAIIVCARRYETVILNNDLLTHQLSFVHFLLNRSPFVQLCLSFHQLFCYRLLLLHHTFVLSHLFSYCFFFLFFFLFFFFLFLFFFFIIFFYLLRFLFRFLFHIFCFFANVFFYFTILLLCLTF